MDIARLARKNIRDLKPYSSARSEYADIDGTLLDANENSIGSVLDPDLNRYPDPFQTELKDQLAKYKNIAAGNIFIGNGSDEAIDLLIRAFCEPGEDEIQIFPPTYGVYSVFAAMNNVAVSKLSLTSSFNLDCAEYKNIYNTNKKITIICNPNNPSGNCFREEDIDAILQISQSLVVIDEAYIDFIPEKSWVNMIEKYPNLVVLQTLSKAWGLAGIRVGMAYASTETIEILNKVKYPYNINRITQKMALRALKNPGKKDRFVTEILEQRQALESGLNQLKIVTQIFPSDANFLLVKFKNAKMTFDYLRKQKIIVRDRSNQIHCSNCLRITVGTKQENVNLLDQLKNLDRLQ